MIDRAVTVAVGLLVVAGPAAAQQVELAGQVRPRFEVRDPVEGLGTVEFTSMRTRAALAASLDRSVSVFVQLQDVRIFGEESGTLTDYSADGLDLHQGWVELGDAEADRWSLRVGRQEAAYGGERLVGAVGWTQQGRSFDGLRVRFRPSDDVVVDGLAFRLGNSFATGISEDESLYGIYSTLAAAGSLDLYGLLHTRVATFTDLSRVTVGGRWVSESDAATWRLEGAYQGGDSDGPVLSRNISAFMIGARVSTQLSDDLTATLWYDHLSGDDDPTDDEIRAFDTLFATNHKFYGYMDLFLNIPAQTAGRGLQDLAVKASWDLGEGRSLGADLHTFHLAAADGLETGRLGEELDLTYRWGYASGVGLTAGLSYFVAADAWSTVLGNPDEDQVWGYAMVDVTF